MGFLSGKSEQKSSNQAYPFLKDALGGTVGAGAGAAQTASSLLSGGPEGQAAFNQYKDSAGYKGVIDAGSDAIVGNNAARGLLRSGATGKAISNFGQETGKSFFKDYMDRLLGLSQQGTQAAGTIGAAGNVQSSKSKPGIGKLLGAGLSLIPGGQIAGAALGGGG